MTQRCTVLTGDTYRKAVLSAGGLLCAWSGTGGADCGFEGSRLAVSPAPHSAQGLTAYSPTHHLALDTEFSRKRQLAKDARPVPSEDVALTPPPPAGHRDSERTLLVSCCHPLLHTPFRLQKTLCNSRAATRDVGIPYRSTGSGSSCSASHTWAGIRWWPECLGPSPTWQMELLAQPWLMQALRVKWMEDVSVCVCVSPCHSSFQIKS